jgi:hypothetical protein
MAFADPWPSCPPTSCLNFTVRDASATSLNLTVRLAGVAVKSTTLSININTGSQVQKCAVTDYQQVMTGRWPDHDKPVR